MQYAVYKYEGRGIISNANCTVWPDIHVTGHAPNFIYFTGCRKQVVAVKKIQSYVKQGILSSRSLMTNTTPRQLRHVNAARHCTDTMQALRILSFSRRTLCNATSHRIALYVQWQFVGR
jgi:hypothetical protein